MAHQRPDGVLGGHRGQFDVPIDERESFLKALPTEAYRTDGFSVRMTPLSKWKVIELKFWADPRKDEAWALEMIATIGMQRFQREFMNNWTMSTQSPFFPEYLARGGDALFMRKHTALGTVPLAIGLDFGFRRPAVAAMQANARKTRLHLLREWMPQNISARAFMEVVEWLIGEYPEANLSAEAIKHVLDLRRAAELGQGPPVPWFSGVKQVLRYAGAEALRTASEVSDETAEKRTADIWQAAGFPLHIWTAPVKARELVLRHLLRMPPPKTPTPFLTVDEWCPLIRQALNGGYTFKKATRLNPAPDEPHKDGYYDNIMDATMYAAANLIDPRRLDMGGPDLEPQVEVTIEDPKRKPRGTYERGEGKESSSSFSTPFGETCDIIGSYSRDEF